jgi:hypothetical protein
MPSAHNRDSEQERLKRYVALQAIYGTTATVGSGPLDLFGGVSAVPTTTLTASAVLTRVRNEPESKYDPELATQVARLAKSSPAAVFNTPEELMDWLDNPQK